MTDDNLLVLTGKYSSCSVPYVNINLTMTPWHQWFVGVQGTPSKPDNVAGMVGAAAFTGIPWP